MADDLLFRGAAPFYARYRPGYPPELVELLAGRFALGPESRVLDLACGTGQLALPLAQRAGEVVAVDAAPGMLAELRARAPANVTAVQARAEELDPALGPFDLTTIGRAFHWLDRRRVLALLESLTRGLVLTADRTPEEDELLWWRAAQSVVREFLGERRRAGGGFFSHSGESWMEILAASPFGVPEVHEFTVERSWQIEEVVGYLHSTSFAAPWLFGERLAEFDDAVYAALARFDQPLRETAVYEALLCGGGDE